MVDAGRSVSLYTASPFHRVSLLKRQKLFGVSGAYLSSLFLKRLLLFSPNPPGIGHESIPGVHVPRGLVRSFAPDNPVVRLFRGLPGASCEIGDLLLPRQTGGRDHCDLQGAQSAGVMKRVGFAERLTWLFSEWCSWLLHACAAATFGRAHADDNCECRIGHHGHGDVFLRFDGKQGKSIGESHFLLPFFSNGPVYDGVRIQLFRLQNRLQNINKKSPLRGFSETEGEMSGN